MILQRVGRLTFPLYDAMYAEEKFNYLSLAPSHHPLVLLLNFIINSNRVKQTESCLIKIKKILIEAKARNGENEDLTKKDEKSARSRRKILL